MKKIIIITIGFVLCNIDMGFAQNGLLFKSVNNLKTPNNSTVQDVYTLISADISPTPGQIALYEAHVNSFGAVLIEPQSYKYDSHGYAWNVAEGGSKVRIGVNTPEAEDIYWTDGSYVEVSESNATKVSYHQDGDHSAIKLDDYWYQSKWGWGEGLVKHTLNGVEPEMQPAKAKKFYRRAFTLTLTGPTLVLNSGSTYTMHGASNVSITWTCSSNLYKISGSGNSATFGPTYPLYDSPGWIQASVDGVSAPRHEVWVGRPVITGIGGNRYPYTSEDYEYGAIYNENAGVAYYGGFQWTLSPSNGYIYDSSGSPYIRFNNTGSCQLLVRATNANGVGEYCSITLYVSDGYSPSSSASTSLYQAYPNPVSDELTVSLRTQLSSAPIQSSGGSNTVGNKVYTVYLYNANGASVRQAVSQGGDQVQLDVFGLPDGIYYLVIDSGDGSKPETHKIIVKH